MNRQCSLGWHDECSDPFGESCECECHPWILRTDTAELLEAARSLADYEAEVWWCERGKVERRTYGFADAHQVCEHQGGRRKGHEKCGFRLKLVAALGADGDTEGVDGRALEERP